MQNLTLYKATELATFENFIDAETGEIDIEAYDNAQVALVEKQRAVTAYTRNLQVRKAGLLAMKANILEPLDAEIKRVERQESFYTDYLFQNMQKSGITRIDALDGSFSAEIKTNPPSTVIDDLEAIPKEFMRIKPPPPAEPDKIAIKEALKSGLTVTGAHLESTQKLVVK
jgi:hypothetical protein